MSTFNDELSFIRLVKSATVDSESVANRHITNDVETAVNSKRIIKIGQS